MGLYIHLSVNFKNIPDKDWEAAWHESLDIFKKFPLPLSRHTVETKKGKKRHVYAQNLILDKGEKDESWYLEGDLLSMQSGETFTMYRHLEAYKTDYTSHHGCFNDSVFKTKDPTYPSSSNGVELWDSKTQWYPFHLAILAVGIMLENKFPDSCYLHGDIEEKQVEVMLDWFEAVYNKKYQQPICFDADRLYEKLDAVYSDKKALFERFTCLYQGGRADEFRALLRFMGKKKTYDYYGNDLNEYESLTQWGARDILRSVLEVTEDVNELVAFVENAIAKRPKKEKPFEWSHVLEMLCGDYIFVNPIERESMKRLTNRNDDMDNINDVFGRLFMKMSGMPHISPLYVPTDELLEIFALRDPKQGDKYRKIIEEYEKKLKDRTKIVDETVEAIDETIEKNTEFQEEIDEKEDIIEKYPLHEQYIVRQALQQQDHFGAYKKNVSTMRDSLQNLLKKHADMYENKTVEAYLKGIYEYSFEAGFGVSEKGWKAIDKLTNLETLKYLFVLATVNNNEMTFWRWRKHIFETPETWQYLKDPKVAKSKGLEKNR
jgi:hypothetical protein